jgi:DNA-binding PadR family transcriptional regulator
MTSLDLIVLLLLQRGVNTPYLLRSRAGISLGGSLPALKRLLGQGLIKQGKQGPRGRREFALTRAGESELANMDHYLEAVLTESAADLDSLLRVATCAIATGRKQVAVQALKKGSDEFQMRSADLRSTLPGLKQDADLADLYIAMTAHCAADRLQATGSSLRSLASRLGKLVVTNNASRRKRR